MKRIDARIGSIALALALTVGGCKKSDDAKPSPPTGSAPAARLDPAQAKETAPAVWKAKITTTKGDFVVEVHRDWAPLGADRFYNLMKMGYYTDVAFFRVVKGFMVQFGIHGDPLVNAVWRDARIPDDATGKQSNTRGTLTFATSGRDSRTVQLFVNYADNANLDAMGFTPVGKVVQGMDVVDALEGEYGEGAPRGNGPSQPRIQSEGNAYLRADFPKMDYVKSAALAP
jgi:peptidyl-prolyl cis-trans isomerase A (cyclophilin A)